MNEYWPGTRVEVFDSLLYINDIITPLSITVRPATVVKWYGYISEYMKREYGYKNACYPSLIDVKFDHRERVSTGHFTTFVKIIS